MLAAYSGRRPVCCVVLWPWRCAMNHLERFFLFDRLGLRRNPFGTLTDEEWADIAIIPQEIQSAFDAGHHLQILGPRGRGKSTILRSLIRRIAWQQKQSAYVHLQRWQGHYHSDIRELDAFALDEAQRLLLWRWWPLLHRAQGGLRLIIGSHRDDRWLFSLFGLHVQTYQMKRLITRAHLQAVLQHRLAYFSTSDEPLIHFTPGAFDYLWARFADNLRAQDFFLYDFFQQLDHPVAITAALLSGFQRLQDERLTAG